MPSLLSPLLLRYQGARPSTDHLPGFFVAALGSLVVVCIFALALIGRQRFSPISTGWLWGLVLVGSFAGWGAALNRWLFPAWRADWGLRSAWGVAVTVVAGGVLCLLTIARREVLFVWVALGSLSLCLELLADHQRIDAGVRLQSLKRLLKWTTPIALGLAALIALQYVAQAAHGVPNPSDDLVAYSAFPHMISSTGTLIDPFSLRRMVSYGGQSFLHALLLLVAEDTQIALLDGGVCWLVLLWLTFGFFSAHKDASRAVAALLFLALITLPVVKINSASAVSGTVMFLALYRTTNWLAGTNVRGARSALVLATIAAAASSMRQHFMLVCGLFLVTSYAFAILRDKADKPDLTAGARAERLKELGLCAALTTALLLPWAALAFRSNHTFLFPIFNGYYNREYGVLASTSDLPTRLKYFLSNMTHTDPIRTLPLFVVLGLALQEKGRHGALASLWLASFVGFVSLVYSLPLAEVFTISRYGNAFLVAYFVAASLAAAKLVGEWENTSDGGRPRLAVPALLIVVALVLQVNELRGTLLPRYTGYVTAIDSNLNLKPPLEAPSPAYRKLQDAVPQKERLLVMVERPSWFDYRRNVIYHIDLPGAVSPPPGMPLFQGPEAMATYLLGQGIRFFAFTKPEVSTNELYRRAHWERQRQSGLHVWKISARFYLAMFDGVDALAKSRKRLYDDGHLVLVDLQSKV